MRKKVFFVVSSLGSGGAERVFWLVSQGFNKEYYDVKIVLLNSKDNFFSMDLQGVEVIDLKTIRASSSFFVLYRLIRKERPYAIYSTLYHINILLAFSSFFVRIPQLIARESNIPDQMMQCEGDRKEKFLNWFIRIFYKRFDAIICQSVEMKNSLTNKYGLGQKKMVIIPNPVLATLKRNNIANMQPEKRLVIVARLVKVKGHDRLLDILEKLPSNYFLTIAGKGPLEETILNKVKSMKMESRVQLVGEVKDITGLLTKHDLLVLSSHTEGFANVVLEALSVGTPVVTFRVGGITGLIRDNFNGYIVEQNDVQGFKNQIIKACNRVWDAEAIKQDVQNRYALNKVVDMYESLIS